MEPSFWLARWQESATGFHRSDTNPRLLAHWAAAGVSAGARVLVPLCGKSVDMLWLAAQGCSVVGVELSPLAVAQFFDAAQLTPTVTTRDALTWHTSGELSVVCGDFFALTDAGFDAVYDRAALIALPPAMRAQYAAHLTARVRPGGVVLLIAVEFTPTQTGGPPFAVHEPEVRALYEPGFTVSELGVHDVIDEEPRFRQRGLTALHERVYRMVRR